MKDAVEDIHLKTAPILSHSKVMGYWLKKFPFEGNTYMLHPGEID